MGPLCDVGRESNRPTKHLPNQRIRKNGIGTVHIGQFTFFLSLSFCISNLHFPLCG